MTGGTGHHSRWINAQVGLALLLARETKRIPRESLADVLDVTVREVEDMETGRRELEAHELLVAAAFLGLPVSYFFEGIDTTGQERGQDEPYAVPGVPLTRDAANDNSLRSV